MRVTALIAFSMLSFMSCGPATSGSADGGSGTTTRPGEVACTTAKDCTGNAVCLEVGNTRSCSINCTANANACGANSSCDGVGSLSIDVCQPPKKTTEENPPKAEEQPNVPCTSDSECEKLQSGTVCAQFKGEKQCTIPCSQEKQCDTPTLTPNIQFDFLTCGADEAQPSRKACIPDEKCFQNVNNCFSASLPGFDGGFPFP